MFYQYMLRGAPSKEKLVLRYVHGLNEKNAPQIVRLHRRLVGASIYSNWWEVLSSPSFRRENFFDPKSRIQTKIEEKKNIRLGIKLLAFEYYGKEVRVDIVLEGVKNGGKLCFHDILFIKELNNKWYLSGFGKDSQTRDTDYLQRCGVIMG